MADASNIGSTVLERGDGSVTVSFINGGRRSTLTRREAGELGAALIKMAGEMAEDEFYADPPEETPAPRVRVRNRTR